MICDVVVDCFGAELVVIQAYPDGSYNCPACGYGVQASEPHCQNPCCYTRPGFPVETARKWDAERAARKAAELDRQRAHESAMCRAETAQAERLARWTEIKATAEAKGACVSCALKSDRYGAPVKYTKHRTACPRER